MRKIMFTILYLCLCQQLLAQEQKTAEQVLAEMDSPTFVPTVKVGKVLYEGDSIQYMEMNNVYVYPQLTFKNKKQAETYMRLVNNVKKVLPIAKEARQMLIETTELLDMLPDEKSKNEHIKRVEEDIFRTYKPKMKKLTYSQGKLLIKLIDRECHSSSYEMIKAFMGPIRAGFWQVCLGLRCFAEERIRPQRTRQTHRTSRSDGRSRTDLSYPLFSRPWMNEMTLKQKMADFLKKIKIKTCKFQKCFLSLHLHFINLFNSHIKLLNYGEKNESFFQIVTICVRFRYNADCLFQ